MDWEVRFHPAFDPEFDALSTDVQDELLAQATLIATFGPFLGRPRVDTLNGSQHANMKELRFRNCLKISSGLRTAAKAPVGVRQTHPYRQIWVGFPALTAAFSLALGNSPVILKQLLTAGGGVWRVAFAFDTERKAVLLAAGDKSGTDERRFYKLLIRKADRRFNVELEQLQNNRRTR